MKKTLPSHTAIKALKISNRENLKSSQGQGDEGVKAVTRGGRGLGDGGVHFAQKCHSRFPTGSNANQNKNYQLKIIY